MLNIIYCREEDRKNKAIYDEIERILSENSNCENKKNIILLVPEQQVLESERITAEMGLLSFDIQVLSFGRLANEIFRRFGGLFHKYISKGASTVLTYRVLCELGDALSEYGEISLRDKSAIRLLQNALTEFKNAGVTSAMLEDAAGKLPSGDSLKSKLEDLTLIMHAYRVVLGNKYADPADDLTLAAQILKENNFFENTSVFINSFDGFTGSELELIKHMIRTAENVTVALSVLPSDGAQCFEKLKNTDRALRHLARENGVKVKHVTIESEISDKNKVLSFLCDNMWDIDARFDGENNAVKFFSCKDDFEQAKCIAADILKKVRDGAEFGDFAVIMRDPEKYLGILDNVFSSCNIPLHFSTRTDIKRHPEIRMISCAISVGAFGWNNDDVISYMRTGMTGLDTSACDELEDYFSLWKTSGKKQFVSEMLQKHPDGFGKEFDDVANERLAELNIYKNALIAPLAEFLSVFDNKEATVGDICKGIYRLIESVHMRDQLEGRVAELVKNSEHSKAEEKRQVWNTIIEALESLYMVASDMKTDAKGFLAIFDTVLDSTDIGKIPQGLSEVIACGALLLRKSNVKHAYVIGVNEGEFPAMVSEDVLIDDQERSLLRELGIDIFKSRDTRVSDELYTFYRAVLIPKESLTFTCLSSRAVSQTLENLMGALGIDKPTAFRLSSENIFCVSDAVELAVSKGSYEYASKFIPRLENRDIKGIKVNEESLELELAHGIFYNCMQINQSKLDSYSMCPQAYFCKYVLRLREKASFEAGANNVGSFIHEILEKYFIELDGRNFQDISQAESKQILDKVLAGYGKDIINEQNSARELGLYQRIERLVRLLADNLRREFTVSSFTPYKYEMAIGNPGHKEHDGVRALEIKVDDDFSVSLCGYIDRVDVYKSKNDAYVRVVDYKTGKKEFKQSDMELGINLQMPLYLRAFCADERLRENLAPNGKLKPAGVLYFEARYPEFDSAEVNLQSGDEVYEKAVKSIKRNGMVLDDEEVIRAMDPEKTGEFAPVKNKKRGEKSLLNEEGFEALSQTVENAVKEKARMMRSGNINADPLKSGGHDACQYCAMRPICRKSDDEQMQDEE